MGWKFGVRESEDTGERIVKKCVVQGRDCMDHHLV